MIKKILFILLLIILITGCKLAAEPSAPQEAAEKSIEETAEITEIQDTEAEKELDGIGSILNDW